MSGNPADEILASTTASVVVLHCPRCGEMSEPSFHGETVIRATPRGGTLRCQNVECRQWWRISLWPEEEP